MAEQSVQFVSNISQAYKNPLAGSYQLTAAEYVNAARRITGASEGIPKLTLLLFALELTLKAYLLDTGTPEKTLKKEFDVRHDLKALYDLAHKSGFVPSDANIHAVIDDYGEDHKAHSFRYGGRDFVDLKDPDRAMTAVSKTVGQIGKLLKMKI